MTGPTVTLAAEGSIDLACIRRLAMDAGLVPGDEYGRAGKLQLDKRLAGYNAGAARVPWIVARDLDRDATCPGQLCSKLLPAPAKLMCLRIAVRSIEAWLLADCGGLAKAFQIPAGKIPKAPEELPTPKAAMINLLARSKSRDVSGAMVRGDHRRGQSLEIGPEYNTRLADFAVTRWSPADAAASSRSLGRAILRISELAATARTRWPGP